MRRTNASAVPSAETLSNPEFLPEYVPLDIKAEVSLDYGSTFIEADCDSETGMLSFSFNGENPPVIRLSAAGADSALIVCSPDPVCIRDAAIVRRLLTELGVAGQRLVINRFQEEYFRSLAADVPEEGAVSGACRDLDDVIDQSGVRLIGIVPEDRKLAAAFARGRLPAADTPGFMALSRIASRLNGVPVPLAL